MLGTWLNKQNKSYERKRFVWALIQYNLLPFQSQDAKCMSPALRPDVVVHNFKKCL